VPSGREERGSDMSVQKMKVAPMDIGLPDEMEFIDHGDSIEIVWKWFSIKFIVMTVFIIFCNTFLFLWYNNFTSKSRLIAFLFPIFQVGVGVSLTYYVLAGWLNRTHVFASHDLLGIRHRPIPWFGNKDIKASDVKQIYSKEKVSKNALEFGGPRNVYYELRIVTNDGRNIGLIKGLNTRNCSRGWHFLVARWGWM
jgi:hypothetical protein